MHQLTFSVVSSIQIRIDIKIDIRNDVKRKKKGKKVMENMFVKAERNVGLVPIFFPWNRDAIVGRSAEADKDKDFVLHDSNRFLFFVFGSHLAITS